MRQPTILLLLATFALLTPLSARAVDPPTTQPAQYSHGAALSL